MPVNITIRGSAIDPLVLSVTSSLTNGGTLTAPVEWTATPSAPVTKVEFLIDGTLVWTENIAPYVFNGDPGGMLDPSILSNGTHTFTVVATAADLTTATSTATMSVDVAVTPPPATAEGRVNFWMYGTSQVDPFVTAGTWWDFMRSHWKRFEGWLDVEAANHPGVMRYDDMIQIYLGSSTAAQHPDWILKHADGTNVMYNGHYLADVGKPVYQDFKANEIAAFIPKGYKGVKCDDVNLDRVVSGPDVINPRTGAPYTLAQWQKDNADMMTKVRTVTKAAKADFEIVHNSLYWAVGADVDRCIQQCDGFQLERGFNDANFTPSTIQTVWTFVNKLHSMGKYAIHLSEATGTQAAHFNLACALLCSNGNDYVYGVGWQPNAWDAIYDTNLGAATNSRYLVGTNVFRRDFALGYAQADLNTKIGTIVHT